MKKKLSLLFAFLLLLAACGEPEPLPQNGENNEPYPDNVIIRDVEGEIQFDWDEALKNIYIAGKKTGFPKTPADFGDGFEFGDFPRDFKEYTNYGYTSWEGNGVSTILRYNDGVFGVGIILRDCTVDDYNANSEILSIIFNSLTEDSSQYGIYGFRIGDDVTKDDIKAFFGEPTTEKEFALYYEFDAPFKRDLYIGFSIFGGILEIGIKN